MAGWRGCAGTAATWRSGAAISGRSKDASSGAELNPVSLRTRLLCALLGVGLLALLATGWQADQRAEVSLRRTAIDQLTSIRAERKRQIEAYFAGVRRDVLTLAESRDVIAAMEEFRTAYRSLEAQVAGWPDQMRARYRSEVSRHYREAVMPHLRAFEPDAGPERARDDVPEDAVTSALQAIFIASNPNPEASRERSDRPATGNGKRRDWAGPEKPTSSARIAGCEAIRGSF